MTPAKILVITIVVGAVGAFVGAVVRLIWIGFRTDRVERHPETTARVWTAHSPYGSVILGSKITHAEALRRASALGEVSWVDIENGFIFFNTDLGKRQHSGH